MKKVVLLLVSTILLACTCAAPSLVAMPTPTEAVFGSGLTIVRLDPADGDLASQLAVSAAAASAFGQHMFVEFDASW